MRVIGKMLGSPKAWAPLFGVPFEHMTEGIRGLLFYEGRLDTGLGTALWVLVFYVLAAVLLCGSISLMRDAVARRRKEIYPAEGASERG